MEASGRSVAYLTAISAVCALIALAQSVCVLRLLGAAQFGVASVVLAFGVVAANFVDVRAADVIAKLYYGAARADHQEGVLQAGLSLHAGLAVLLFVVCLSLSAFLLSTFTSTVVPVSVLIGFAAAQSVTFAVSVVGYLQRFTERFAAIGALQLLGSLLSAGIIVSSVSYDQSLQGYANGLLCAAIASATLTMAATSAMWRRAKHEKLFRRFSRNALAQYWRHRRLLVATNVLGYTKLLHRAADVLLVGYFLGDRETGLYKLARSITDVLYMAFDAATKVYQPALLKLLQQAKQAAYQAQALALLRTAVFVTAAIVIAESLFLRETIALLFGIELIDAAEMVIVLTIPFLFVYGVHSWAWPLVIFYDRLGQFVFWQFIAIVVGQYACGIVLLAVMQDDDPIWFAAGYVLSYVLLYGMFVWKLREDRSALVPRASH